VDRELGSVSAVAVSDEYVEIRETFATGELDKVIRIPRSFAATIIDQLGKIIAAHESVST
jgi:hypothetical protein